MKKILLTIVSVFSFLSVFAVIPVDLIGTWKIENVEYTFTQDTLFIDEIGIEGFAYTYNITGDTVMIQTEIDKLDGVFDTFRIVSLDKNECVIQFDGSEALELKRK